MTYPILALFGYWIHLTPSDTDTISKRAVVDDGFQRWYRSDHRIESDNCHTDSVADALALNEIHAF